MNEKTKPDKQEKLSEAAEKKPDDLADGGDEASRSRDRREKSYYYDDACGYEIYRPEADDEKDDDDDEYEANEQI